MLQRLFHVLILPQTLSKNLHSSHLDKSPRRPLYFPQPIKSCARDKPDDRTATCRYWQGAKAWTMGAVYIHRRRWVFFFCVFISLLSLSQLNYWKQTPGANPGKKHTGQTLGINTRAKVRKKETGADAPAGRRRIYKSIVWKDASETPSRSLVCMRAKRQC